MKWFRLIAAIGLAGAPVWAQPRAVAVAVDGVVHPITVEVIRHALEQARDAHAQVVIVRLNTPGGLLNATREIVHEMLASPVPVVTYVTPSGGRAASAGFFLLEAGDVAAMAPGTNTGAASPVLIGQEMDPVMRRKVENDTAALLRSVTSRRGRNTELAESAVREAKAFTDKEALDNKLIDLIAAGELELLAKLDGREITRWDGGKVTLRLAGVVIEEARLSLRERVIAAIADPNIGFILLVLGALGLYIEFSSPGLIFPGVAGGLMLLLGLASLSVLPINWLGAALLVLALSMFVLEAKFHSHAILGTGGTIAMVLGALLLVDGPPAVRIHLSTALGVALPFALITMFLVSIVVRARRNKVMTGASGMLHEVGVARTALEPEGKVLLRGEYWDAVSSVTVPVGMRVRVVEVRGMVVRVEPV
ncbi:MAG: nodulation protein NfeD [Acidobacteriota bacterium]|nr:nodulation protein NfeD [Acidobacteriota bacterium]